MMQGLEVFEAPELPRLHISLVPGPRTSTLFDLQQCNHTDRRFTFLSNGMAGPLDHLPTAVRFVARHSISSAVPCPKWSVGTSEPGLRQEGKGRAAAFKLA